MIISDAAVSECGAYRMWLRRVWDRTKPVLMFCMLNPSTADAQTDDPTVRKCVGFATRFNYGGIVIVNLFSYRATDPKDLHLGITRMGMNYMVGPTNDATLNAVFWQHDLCVCAWGANARRYPGRVSEVLHLMHANDCKPMALAYTHDGAPCHPLMLPYSCKLRPYDHQPL